MKKSSNEMTVLEAAYRATGSLRKAGKIGAFVTAWGITRSRLGRSPSVEEYAADWKVDRRTAFREQQLFRSAFPGLQTPDPIVDKLEEKRALGQIDFGSLQVA